MDKEVRIPQQKRSIEKKEKIVQAAEQLFSREGYFGVTTAEIAKEAGLSTGTVYSYFKDKKDIFIADLYTYGDKLIKYLCDELAEISTQESMKGKGKALDKDGIMSIVKKLLKVFIKFHDYPKKYHDEIEALRYMDEDVKNYFSYAQNKMMTSFAEQFKNFGVVFRREPEQMLLIFSLLNSIEDEMLFNLTPGVNKDILIDECASIITNMLEITEN